ncbi:MAG: lipid-A-disaccharide synthase [Alphaproteobacteria bacterium]|nr:lipid-A-disaccharide synthase [Alphaproteobacteria bacterium]
MAQNDEPLIYLIAGEPSGDLLASRLMNALKEKTNGKVRFAGVGGETMIANGFESLFDSSELAVMGLAEVIPSIPRIMARIRQTVDDIVAKKPDVVVTVDSWSFCARVNKGLRSLNTGIPQMHYVAPQVWAWKKRRAKTCGRYIDRLMALLPYEAKYFEPYGLKVDYVGHPVVEGGAAKGNGAAFRKANDIPEQTKLLCVLPGSRRSETKYLLPAFKGAVEILARKYPEMHVVMPTVVTVEKTVREATADWALPVHIVTGEANRYDAFAACDAALAASGTVALELAMAKVPYTIAYQTSWFTARLIRMLVTGKYANLVNIMAGREIVKEHLLEDCTPEKLAAEAEKLLDDEAYRTTLTHDAFDVLKTLGAEDPVPPSMKAAEAVLETARKAGN